MLLQEGFLKTDADLRLESGHIECQRIRREVAKAKQQEQGSDDDEEVSKGRCQGWVRACVNRSISRMVAVTLPL